MGRNQRKGQTTDPSTSMAARVQQALSAGKTPEDVVGDLVAGGLSRPSAERFVERALAEPSRPAARTATASSPPPESGEDTDGRGALLSGAFWFSVGATVTGATYLLAAPGQKFTVAYGAVVAGLIALGRGLKRWIDAAQPFPWLRVLAALAAPPIIATAIVGGSALLQNRRHETRREAEDKRLAAARAVQEEARLVVERGAYDDARSQAHSKRVALFRGRLQTSTRSETVCDAAVTLKELGAREAIPDLLALLNRTAETPSTRGCAAFALAGLGEVGPALAFYEECARAGTVESRSEAFGGFLNIGPPAAVVALPFLRDAIQSPNTDLRFLAVRALARLGPAAEPVLREAARDAEPRVRDLAAQSLAALPR